MQLKKIIIALCLSVLFLQLAQILYFQREIFFTSYDVSYWKDRVEHSRYVLPLSDRGISDDQFYAYGGYKVIEGQDPTSLVYDKPALGVAIVGIFGYYFHNPAFTGLFFGIGILILAFLLMSRITKSVVLGLVMTTFLVLDPLFTQNLSLALLDLPQLFFLVLNLYILVLIGKNKKFQIIAPIFAGVTLGIFAQIKIPVIYPFVFALELFWLYRTFGRFSALSFIIGNGLALFVGYIPYAVHNYSFVEFLKIQKFVLAFYRDSNLPLHPEAIWQYLFLGSFPGIVDRISSRVNEWSLIYPIATVLGIFMSFKVLKSKEHYLIKSFAIIVLVSLLIFTLIPSYPRYIIIILPFLYFFLTKALFIEGEKKVSILIVAALFMYALCAHFYYYHQSPSYSLRGFYNSFSHQYFQDVYQEHADKSTRDAYAREEFKELAMQVFADARIKDLVIKEGQYNHVLFADTVDVPIQVTYHTEYLGTFTEEKNITLVRENDKWRVKWQWDYLLNEYTLDTTIESTRVIGTRGTIFNNSGKALAQDTDGYLVSFNPRLMNGEQEKDMLDLFSRLSYVRKTHLQNAYLENPAANTYSPLFTTTKTTPQSVVDKLLSFKGVKVEAYPTRMYSNLDPQTTVNTLFDECCTRIYSSYNYHGNEKKPSAELKFDARLSGYDGGSLVIRNKKGEVQRTIIRKDKKDGQNVTL